MTKHRLLGIAGSLRRESTNRKLLHEAKRLYGPCDFSQADIRLPLYDGDLEDSAGIPVGVQKLADQIANADAVVIAGPEYNKSISGVLKNALDWVSRTEGSRWLGKPVAIMSAAAGRTGGEATQFALRLAMVPFRARLLQGPQVMVAAARTEFDDAGHLLNDRTAAMLTRLMAALRSEADQTNPSENS